MSLIGFLEQGLSLITSAVGGTFALWGHPFKAKRVATGDIHQHLTTY
jgi:hypothetical protein